MSKEFKKLLNIVFLIAICLTCAFCGSKNADNVKVENENDKTESNSMEENVEEAKIEKIDLSDVEDENLRALLVSVDELNQTLGQDVYVSKEDCIEYKDVKVSLIGDSIAEFSKTHLKKFFKNIWQDSVPGREMVVGIEAYDQMAKIDRVGDIMILSLGNNALRGIELEVLEHVYEGVNGRPLIIPTIVMPYAGQERNRNRELRHFVETHDNCYIADWNKVARMSDKFISEDGVHPTGDGSKAYAQLLYKTVVDIVKNSR